MSPTKEAHSLPTLADDCLLDICSYLNGYDVYAMKHVCQRLFHFVANKMAHKVIRRQREYRDFSIIQSSIGFSILVRPFADDDYQYLFIVHKDGSETTELVLPENSVYKEAISFSSSSREMQNIPNRILEKMAEILNRRQIRLVKFVNVSLSDRLTKSMDNIQNYRKSVVFDSCYEHFNVRWGPSYTPWICDWLLSETDSLTIEKCTVSCHFQDLLHEFMEHANKRTDHILIMKGNIYESTELKPLLKCPRQIRYENVIPSAENIWRFKHIEIDTNVLNAKELQQNFETRLRNNSGVGIWKFPVSTRRVDNFHISVSENTSRSREGGRVDKRGETTHKTYSGEFMLEVTVAGSSVTGGTIMKRDDYNRVEFTISNDNILTAQFEPIKW